MRTTVQPSAGERDLRRDDFPASWEETLRHALVAGLIVSAFTVAAAALRGRADSGSAVAPINATSHVVYGPRAGDVDEVDLEHTLPGLAINTGASLFWATIYERLFGRADAGRALLGGAAVAALAYLVDYHLVPKRLTPGWEERVSDRSLAAIFGAMAVSLPIRRLLEELIER
ncbi:MAG TPA: hypothetical protein VKZ85_03225 [Woeseiaceae bacterium]|nr:hypothetical protein [Woeseiaceae bacterium]